MTQVDVGSIVPSTRDLLQVLSTRRKSTALVALLDADRAAEEAARLHELNVSAFALAEPGPAMSLCARATKTVPTLCLASAADREDFLRARFFGADGVCIDASLPLDEWDRRAKSARMTRMLPLALALDAAGVEGAIKAGAKALLVRAASAEELLALLGNVPRSMTLVAEITGADAAGLRKLKGLVDAALVPASVHTSAEMADLVAELDP
jgi:indole-3-glycerol phosphate synthase